MLDLSLFDLSEIVSIEELEEQETYDITLEDHHCLFANGIYTHNSGLNADIVTMESISEAFNKCFVADFIFSVSRTIDDKKTNSGRIFIAKNRNGPDGIVMPIYMDTSVVKIEVLEKQKEEVSEEAKPKKAKAKRKEIFDKFRTPQ